MKKITRILSAVLSVTLLTSIITVAPFSIEAAETNQDVSVAYSEEAAEAVSESSSEPVTEPLFEETTVESHFVETTIAQTVEETTAVPKAQNSSKTIEPVGASAGVSVSANGIENKINTLSQALANAEITHFTNNGEAAGSEESNCYLPNINDSLSKAGLPTGAEAVNQGASAGYSCYGFASYVFWYLYRSNFRYTPTVSTPSYGDLLEFNGAHYAIYLGESNGNYYVYDSNWDYQCTIQMHEIPKSWNDPVTIYHATNYSQVFDSEPPKTGGHVDFQRGTMMQGATPINTFVLKYTATDNISVSRVYAHVWEFGKTEDQATTYEGALSGQNVTITIPQSEMPESTYSIECYAEDATGNRASIGVKRTYFPIYKVIEDTGTYKVTADTAPIRHSPYEKINEKSTDSGQYHKGLKVSITGYYINSYGNKWYQLDNTNWIYSGNVKNVSNGLMFGMQLIRL